MNKQKLTWAGVAAVAVTAIAGAGYLVNINTSSTSSTVGDTVITNEGDTVINNQSTVVTVVVEKEVESSWSSPSLPKPTEVIEPAPTASASLAKTSEAPKTKSSASALENTSSTKAHSNADAEAPDPTMEPTPSPIPDRAATTPTEVSPTPTPSPIPNIPATATPTTSPAPAMPTAAATTPTAVPESSQLPKPSPIATSTPASEPTPIEISATEVVVDPVVDPSTEDPQGVTDPVSVVPAVTPGLDDAPPVTATAEPTATPTPVPTATPCAGEPKTYLDYELPHWTPEDATEFHRALGVAEFSRHVLNRKDVLCYGNSVGVLGYLHPETKKPVAIDFDALQEFYKNSITPTPTPEPTFEQDIIDWIIIPRMIGAVDAKCRPAVPARVHGDADEALTSRYTWPLFNFVDPEAVWVTPDKDSVREYFGNEMNWEARFRPLARTIFEVVSGDLVCAETYWIDADVFIDGIDEWRVSIEFGPKE